MRCTLWLLGSIIVISAAAFVGWRGQPSNGEDGISRAPKEIESADLQGVAPVAGGEVAEVMLPEAGEKQSMALEIADRITRESIQLSHAQAGELMDFVRGPKPASLSEGEWHHRVNSILNALRIQREAPKGFADLLMDTASRHEDPVLGLYALQHLSLWLPRESDPGKQQAIKDLFSELMRHPGEPMAGAAVLMSSDLERQQVDGFDPALIEQAALHLVADKQVPQDVRVSALHACTDRHLTNVLEEARHIAADKSEVSTLRKAAIHAIGRMGQEADLPLLEEVSKESRHLAAATTPATARITQRISKP